MLSILALGASAAEIPLEVGVQIVGPESKTSFPRQLLVQLTNPAYTAVNLLNAMNVSELIIDGKESKRTAPFHGPAGIAAVSDWSGCLSFADYAPAITPGKHKVSVKVGNALSSPLIVRWEDPVDWHKGNLKTRKKEIQKLAEVIVDGLPRDCVEHWLPVKDGGQQEEDKVRYFLEPQFKIVVPYRQMYEQSGLHEVVDGPPQVYEEARLHD